MNASRPRYSGFLPLLALLGSFQSIVPLAHGEAESAAAKREFTLSQWKFGKLISGEDFKAADLKGKVVLIENWGVRCGPCLEAMPFLAKLDKQFRDEGLVIIGSECQNSSRDAIDAVVKQAKVEFPITGRAMGPIAFRTIPNCHLFDRDGKMIYNGYPEKGRIKAAIREALAKGGSEFASGGSTSAPTAPASKEVPALLIPSRAWTNAEGKSITAAVRSIDGSTVTFVMPDGKEVPYPVAKLSEGSRKDLEAAGAGGNSQ